MLKISWPKAVTGQVQITLKGERIGQFLDYAVQAGIPLENLVWMEEDKLSIHLALRHFFPMYRAAKMYKLQIRIYRKLGMPFIWKRVKKRRFFAIGAILFFLILTSLSSFVWKVDIEGNKQVPNEQILSLLRTHGVYPGQLKVKLPQTDTLQFEMQQKLPQASWIGVRLEGTRIVVTVAEKRQIEQSPEQVKMEGKFHLIAKKDAMIYQMQITHGQPLVGVNHVVKKGQVLVSGYYGNPEAPETGEAVGASGVVLGQVWYQSEVYAPMKLERKEYTGARQKKKFLFLGSYIVRNPFSKQAPFEQYEMIQEVRPIQIGSWEFPFGLVEEEYLEMKNNQEKLSEDQATLNGLDQARADVLRAVGKHGKILEEKILHRSIENGKVYLKIHFDVIENIAVPEPLTQGDGTLDPTKTPANPPQPSE
ncbi:sporulation protein YqfD [Risungbinella massiliensis]|uniref:sporulation protein YqfD n=1 Tax=Risungbinella massiliensis TaxID=1329796 RepID=UPI0005CBF74C|nr:sporulation protein YqfD [Risungbinella massiliensis]